MATSSFWCFLSPSMLKKAQSQVVQCMFYRTLKSDPLAGGYVFGDIEEDWLSLRRIYGLYREHQFGSDLTGPIKIP